MFCLSEKKRTRYVIDHFSDKKNSNEGCQVLASETEVSLTARVSRGTVTDSPRCSVKPSILFPYKTVQNVPQTTDSVKKKSWVVIANSVFD